LNYIKDSVIDEWIAEEIGYFDLTTNECAIGKQSASIEIITRSQCVVCGCEEAKRIAQKLDLSVENFLASGVAAQEKTTVFKATGNAENIHLIWRVTQNIISFASTIATRTNRLVLLAKAINPSASIGCTRKSIPNTKALSLKAVLSGGGSVHRASLTETFLLFNEHRVFFEDDKALFNKLREIKKRLIEKKITIEAKSVEEAIRFAPYADILQLDKLSPIEVEKIKTLAPNAHIAIAGGIDPDNIEDYVKAGADSIVSSWMFFCDKPVDFEIKISKV
jgi:molybdenum transport protein